MPRASVSVAGLLVALLAAGAGWGSARAAEVAAREVPLTLPYYVKAVVPGTEKDARPRHENKREADRQYTSVVLENEFVRVQLIPELGGVVYQAVHKPTGDDYFYYERLGKNWYTFWESGVKASFPKAEHGMMNFGQPASYRIYRAADGSVTLAQWMESSRNNLSNPQRRGAFSRMFLGQNVTLRPGEACFSITYRIVNPSPWWQGRRVWNDAFYPRNQTEKGAVQAFEMPPEKTLTELIYPASYLSFHRGEQFRKWDPKEAKLGDIAQMFNSYFAWDIPYGFVGLWYPTAQVNRLRLFDPQAAPGAKIYFEGEGSHKATAAPLSLDCNYNFVEVWGGTDTLFEGVENWIGPGEAFQFTHTFTTVSGIGKVDYADAQVAVHVGFGGKQPQAEVVTLRPVERLTAEFDGVPLRGPSVCGPAAPARFPLPYAALSGRLVLRAGTQVLLDRKFPLETPDNKERHPVIWQSLKNNLPTFGEMMNDNPERGTSARNSIGAHPDGSVGRGRALYRDGQLDAAILCLEKALVAHPEDGEGWHLLGCARLEKNQEDVARAMLQRAVSAPQPYPPARYFLALLALRRGDPMAAQQALEQLAKEIPAHWEARLLHASVTASLPEARALEAEDPSDPRVQWVLQRAARGAGDRAAEAAAGEALAQLLKEPGAAVRMSEFEAGTQGKYVPPARLGQKTN